MPKIIISPTTSPVTTPQPSPKAEKSPKNFAANIAFVSEGEKTHVIRPQIDSLKPSSLYDRVSDAVSKARELGSRYLNPCYLCQKARNAIRAKVFPLSDPPGWKEKMDRISKSVHHLSAIKTDLERKIPNESNLNIRESLEKKLNDVARKLSEKQQLAAVLKGERSLQIQGRFAGYTGTAVNLVAPGLGPVASLAVTGAVTVQQETNAQALPDGPEAQTIKQNTRCNTGLTAISTVACMAFSYYAMPVAKQLLWNAIATT